MSISEKITTILKELPQGVNLVAVSKYHNAEAIMQAYSSGQRVFGESRPQELLQKVIALPKDIEWHFIGHLQSNKLKMVLPYASLIHSVADRNLLEKIVAWATTNNKSINILLQVYVGEEKTKQGFSKEELYSVIEEVIKDKDRYKMINIQGLMAMASNTENRSLIDKEFKEIEEIFYEIKHKYNDFLTNFKDLSIGMSNDYDLALKHSTTYIRVGSRIFGDRKY